MAAAIVVPASVIVGNKITVTGTGFTTGKTYGVRIYNQEQSADVEFTPASGAGTTIDMSTVGTFAPAVPGTYTVVTRDITTPTPSEVVTAQVKVYAV